MADLRALIFEHMRTTEAVCHDRPFRYVPRIHFVEVKISLCSAAGTWSRNAPILATARQFALINSNYRCQVSVRHRILKPLTFDRMNRTEVHLAPFSNMACSLLICMLKFTYPLEQPELPRSTGSRSKPRRR